MEELTQPTRVQRRLLLLILLGGFAARVAVGLVSENILWPDEIFQYLEQGHRLVFGYGYVPWEYRYAARSWLLPGFIAFWLWLCKAAQLDVPTVYIPFIKLVFSALGSTLIYSGYRVASNIAGTSAGLLAALLIAGWYELIYIAHKPLTEVMAMYALMACLAFATRAQPSRWHGIHCGALAGLVAALRIQYVPCLLVIGAHCLVRWPRQALGAATLALALALLLAGGLDRITWGGWFATYLTGYRLNAVLHVSDWFGTAPVLWYVGALSVTSAGLLWLPLALGWVRRLVLTRLPVLCATALLMAHSLISHKEYRFIIAAVPLAWVTGAIVLARARMERRIGQRPVLATIAVFFGISALGISYRLPAQPRVYSSGPLLARWPVLQAYRAVSKDPRLGALLSIEDPRYRPPAVGTGGYYYLHRDVPIYFPSELGAAAVRRAELAEVVTHLIVPRGGTDFPDFQVVSTIGPLVIGRRGSESGAVRALCPPASGADSLVDQALAGIVAPVLRVRSRCPQGDTTVDGPRGGQGGTDAAR